MCDFFDRWIGWVASGRRVVLVVAGVSLLAAAGSAGAHGWSRSGDQRPIGAGGGSSSGQIVFGSEHGGEDEIWVMNADGTNKHNLTRHDGAKISDIDPRWSPDGSRIAFSSDPGGNRQIWIMNADGSGAHQLTNVPGANR